MSAGGVWDGAAASSPRPMHDVLVVGGGLSGLKTAVDLQEQHGIGKVLVLEARDRVGGRTWTVQHNGKQLDAGGMWIGPQQRRVSALVEKLGVPLVRQYDAGRHMVRLAGEAADSDVSRAMVARVFLSVFINDTIHDDDDKVDDDDDDDDDGDDKLASAAGDDDDAEAELEAMRRTFEEMLAPLDVSQPHLHPRAREYDAVTLHQWLRDNVRHEQDRALIAWVAKECSGRESHQMSLLFWLFFLKQSGGLAADMAEGACSQESRIGPGAQCLSERLADRLGRHRIVLDAPVARVEQKGGDSDDDDGLVFVSDDSATASAASVSSASSASTSPHSSGSSIGLATPPGTKMPVDDDDDDDDAADADASDSDEAEDDSDSDSDSDDDASQRYCVVTTRDGRRFYARRVVMAMPIWLLPSVSFEPALPAARLQLAAAMPPGAVRKIHVWYRTAWWRRRGLSGLSVSAAGGPLTGTYDATPDAPLPAGVGGVLVTFLAGDDAVAARRLEAAERRAMVLAAMAALFDDEAAHREVVDYHEHDWKADGDEFAGGCYYGCPLPGALAAYGGEIRRRHGAVHWAGTDAAREWFGYMEGALESGERCAAEVADALRAALRPAAVTAAGTAPGVLSKSVGYSKATGRRRGAHRRSGSVSAMATTPPSPMWTSLAVDQEQKWRSQDPRLYKL